MKKLAILCFLIGLLPIVHAFCLKPSENLEIKENTVFCHEVYNIENGIKVASDNIVIDCNNSVLMGNGIGYGILLKGIQNAAVKNCNVTNYEIGIFLDNSNNNILMDNQISNNRFGIVLQNSVGNDVDKNVYYSNAEDKKIINIDVKKEEIMVKNNESMSQQKIFGENNNQQTSYNETQLIKKTETKKEFNFRFYLITALIVIILFFALHYKLYKDRYKVK